MNTFEKNIISIYGRRGQEWLHRLPDLVCQISQIWNLTHLQPIETMTYNYVLSGFQKENPIILKLSLDAERLQTEETTLKFFSKYGAFQFFILISMLSC
ncbi:MAG: hypothetical protein J0H12_01170 [Candidatus Paracaedimonas acanthamoebae]|uniref:Uncharacterized protein n=1 Tax=Candidatus Paracaedimonas acanthamoebae TaxID=244581 RepID=A0A8J7TSN1_9PROT|nr:hypothetical protein [Candidatus Paracaedimonas acanthamoebae]